MTRASAGGCYRYPLAAIVRQFSSWPKQIDLKAAMVPAETLPSNEGSATSFASTLLSKTLKVCTRALTPEQDFESASYSSHETNGGSMKADKAVGAGFSTSVAGLFLDTSSGYSYWKAHSTAQQYCAARLRLDNTKSSAYTETDLIDNKSDAPYSHAGRPGEVPDEVGGLTCFQRVCLQPIICRLSGRHVPTAGYAGKPLGFLRGGEVHSMQVQTRSYKTRMANRSTRDLKKRLLVQKFEMKRAHYKAICHDRSLPNQIRYDFALKLSKLPRNSSKTRLKNRCVFTGRSHSVYRKFGISRLVFRELALKGALTGVHKASW